MSKGNERSNGNEGNKTADRFVTVGDKGTSNPAYLNSQYSAEVTSLLTYDTRPTYDEYIEDKDGLKGIEGEGTDKSPYIIDTYGKFEKVFRNRSYAPKDKVYLLTGFDKEPLTLPEDFRPIAEAFALNASLIPLE